MADRYVDTPGLDRLAAMQRTPVGASRLMGPPSDASSQYRQQASMYGQALRNLSRAARRGDARAAVDAVQVRHQANAGGFMPGGIRSYDTFQGDIAAREQAYQTGAQDLEAATRINRGATGLVAGRTPSFGSPDPKVEAAKFGANRFQRSGYLAGVAPQQTDTPESYEETTPRPVASPSRLETTYSSFEAPRVPTPAPGQSISPLVQQALAIRDRARQGAYDIPRSLAEMPSRPERPLVVAGNTQDPAKFGLTSRSRWWDSNRR